MPKKQKKPYKIVGAYDSETANIIDGLHRSAYPMLHQLGLLDGTPIEEIGADNVEAHTTINLYRHAIDLYCVLDDIVHTEYGYVPIICCHNLSFDMYGLSSWLDNYDVRVLAKSRQKPITFTVRDDDGNARLVLWDTLVFSGQPLSRMGVDCGYVKAVGDWDYDLVRTPETPLTDDETNYARRDVYALLAWLGWWLRRNPDIAPERLGLNVVTKTGVVRERRRVRFDGVKGNNPKYNIGRFWLYVNRTELPKTDDELYTMHASTRGGFTFCASRSASVPYDLVDTDRRVYGFDATSQHPAQMVSHRYPVKFHETSPKALEIAFRNIGRKTVKDVLRRFSKPFISAFYACFEFTGLRPKKGSIYEKYGVYPLASARFSSAHEIPATDNEQGSLFRNHLRDIGYKDEAVNPTYQFGKLVSADRCILFMTELTAWEISMCYEWDGVCARFGYMTNKFIRPTDMATVSVMQFYKAKNLFKAAREQYYSKGTIDNGDALRAVNVPNSIVSSMENGTLSDSEVDLTYLALKSDLNALFGIEACNEFRRDTVLTPAGIDYAGEQGLCNAPKNPKAWYQFGQRIVGWSRIAQICVMELMKGHIEGVINGDTDSIKVLANVGGIGAIESQLELYAQAVDKAKDDNCKRVKAAYPKLYDKLEGIGHYVLEFESERFCASWNKAYCTHDVDKRDGKRKFAFTLAGIPARLGVNQCADYLYAKGDSFGQICDTLLGYNVTYAYSMTHLNARSFPEWGDVFADDVTDYLGNTAHVVEPKALALYPMSKTVNSLSNVENRANFVCARENRPTVNYRDLIIHRKKDGDFIIEDVGEDG